MYVYEGFIYFSESGTGNKYYVDDEDWHNLQEKLGRVFKHIFQYFCRDANNLRYIFLCDHRYNEYIQTNGNIFVKVKTFPEVFSYQNIHYLNSLRTILFVGEYITDNDVVLKEIPGLPVKIGSHIDIGYQRCHNPKFCIREYPVDGFEREDLLEYFNRPRISSDDDPNYSSMSREELLEEIRKEYEEVKIRDYSFGSHVYINLRDHYSDKEELCPIHYHELEFYFVKNSAKAVAQ